ncbi:hypothetical protein J4444_04685 [Candidatus Woesearchaeota archaeon]|nr:hypothetical protein [Candidatus Woesearchaeota archaeon]
MVGLGYNSWVNVLQQYGVLDFLLPFLLVFTIIYAVLSKTKILGGEEKKQFNIIVALVLALLFVVPHMLGTYPLGYDPVAVLNATLPSISLVAVAAIMLLLLMGVFGTDFSKTAAPFIAVIAILFVIYIFGASLNVWRGPYDIFYWWTTDVTELLIVLIVFGLIVYFITKEPTKTSGNRVMESFGKLFEKKF